DKLHTMAEALIKYETIDRYQIQAIMEGREPGPPVAWDDDDQPPQQGQKGDQGDESPQPDDAAGKGTIGGPASQH
ncbi:MAG: ATP-dependent metalloprotease, partial [Halofilum sp. (in: g-proteobacteria)]